MSKNEVRVGQSLDDAEIMHAEFWIRSDPDKLFTSAFRDSVSVIGADPGSMWIRRPDLICCAVHIWYPDRIVRGQNITVGGNLRMQRDQVLRGRNYAR